MSTRPAASGKTYHHGDLSHRLVEEAILMMQEGGLAVPFDVVYAGQTSWYACWCFPDGPVSPL